VGLVAVVAVIGPAGDVLGQSLYYDRNKVPGNYTVGIYADEKGQTREITLEEDSESFVVHIGITGDSTKVFSGLAFGLDMPEGIELDGAIRWRPIEGLSEFGILQEEGIQVEFNKVCQEQTTSEPLMMGRIRFRVNETFESGEIVLRGHRRFGVSLELCKPDEIWPKPYATGLGVTVERKSGLWNKMKGLFD
jgi:hypothetical protein